MEIKGEDLHLALSEAVMKAFKPETMTEVFRESLRQFLFTPRKTQYGEKPSPFSEAFEKALSVAAGQVAAEFIRAPEQAERVQGLIRSAFNEAMINESLKKKIMDKFTFALGGL